MKSSYTQTTIMFFACACGSLVCVVEQNALLTIFWGNKKKAIS